MTPAAHMTSYHSGRRQLEGYIAYPEGDGPFPGLVLIHEIFGLIIALKVRMGLISLP